MRSYSVRIILLSTFWQQGRFSSTVIMTLIIILPPEEFNKAINKYVMR